MDTLWEMLRLLLGLYGLLVGVSFIGFFVLSIVGPLVVDAVRAVRNQDTSDTPEWLMGLLAFLHYAWLLPILSPLWIWEQISVKVTKKPARTVPRPALRDGDRT